MRKIKIGQKDFDFKIGASHPVVCRSLGRGAMLSQGVCELFVNSGALNLELSPGGGVCGHKKSI